MSTTLTTQSDPILLRFRSALVRAYGDRVERIVLFGSRARSEARLESDYDIAVFLTDLDDRWVEVDRLTEIELDIMDDTGAVIHAIPFPAGAWAERTPLMHEIRREGLDL